MTAQDKNRFRTSVAWKRFREQMMKDNNYRCQMCGKRYSGARKRILQCHHLFPDDYMNLDPERFRILCSGCHTIVEEVSVRLKAKSDTFLNKDRWVALTFGFLPH